MDTVLDYRPGRDNPRGRAGPAGNAGGESGKSGAVRSASRFAARRNHHWHAHWVRYLEKAVTIARNRTARGDTAMLIFALFADGQDYSALVGGTGLGGLGLLGVILWWIAFKHLPAKDAQLATLVERHSLDVATVVKTHADALTQSRADFKESLKMVVDHCDSEMVRNDATIRDLNDSIRTMLKTGKEAGKLAS
jgi:hypothetical protein